MFIQKCKTALSAIALLKNWPRYFKDYWRIPSPTYIFFTLRNGITFKLRANTNDRVIFNEIWLRKAYIPSPDCEIRPDDIVVDIGAHIGFFSIYAAEKARRGKVYAFEPVPENVRLLEENVKHNNLRNVIPIQKAVSGKSEKRDFIISEGSVGGHSFAYEEGIQKNSVQVESVALDEWMERENIRIDFLKMDCEGAEYEILFNMKKEYLKKIQRISMEYHDIDKERNGESLQKFLEDNGFSISRVPHEGNMLYASRV